MPNTVYISHVIDAPIEKVWGVMRDFNGMPAYHPGILESIIESDYPSDQVGCVRRLTLGEGFVRERLLCLDDRNYVFTYEIIEGTLPPRSHEPGANIWGVVGRFRGSGRRSRRHDQSDRQQSLRCRVHRRGGETR